MIRKTKVDFVGIDSDSGAFIYIPTGEDITALIQQPEFIYYGAVYGLTNLVGGDDTKLPPIGWEGTIDELSAYTGIDAETVAQQYGYSYAVMSDCGVRVRVF